MAMAMAEWCGVVIANQTTIQGLGNNQAGDKSTRRRFTTTRRKKKKDLVAHKNKLIAHDRRADGRKYIALHKLNSRHIFSILFSPLIAMSVKHFRLVQL